ncbi:MAG: DUF481 domain-containing protein [Planctomycetaceae bacterium]
MPQLPIRQLVRCAIGCFLCLLAGIARGGEGEVLVFKSGERIAGTSLGFVDGTLRWQMSTGGVVGIPLDVVDRVEFTKATTDSSQPAAPDSASTSEPAEPCDPDEDDETGYFYEVEEVFTDAYHSTITQAKKWTNRIEFGGQFLDGNSEQDSLTVKGLFENKQEHKFYQVESGGQYGRADGVNTSNRWFANGTCDCDNQGNWITFITAKNEFDEFENLNYRGTYSTGIGYRFFNDDKRRLITRVGPGLTHERYIHPFDTRTSPDLFGEVEFRWPMFDRLELEHKSTINPTVEDLKIFRLVSTYGISLRLDEDARWNLKLGMRHEYHSKPNTGRENSDYTTNILLVYVRK